MGAAAHGAALSSPSPGENPRARRDGREVQLPRARGPVDGAEDASRYLAQIAWADARRDTSSDEATPAAPGNGHPRTERVHQRRPELLPRRPSTHAREARLLRRSAPRPVVEAQTRTPPPRMVARV